MGIEGAATFFKNSGKAVVGGLYDASADVVGVGQSAAELQFATKPLGGRVLPVDVGGMIARPVSLPARHRGRGQALDAGPTACCRAGEYSGLSSLSRNLASLPLFFPGGRGAALAGMTLPSVGHRVRQGATLSWASALRSPSAPRKASLSTQPS